MIKIEKLNKYYHKGKSNEIHVINHTDLELPSKGLVSLLGPSGSGKTTLLNVIGGLDKAKGDIIYDDKKIHNYSMSKVDAYRKDNIGYIFQNYNLLHEETVYNNLAIALEMIGIIDKEEVDKRIEYTLKAVGMYKYRKKQAYALSGGQQQRVAIARALVKDAKIIIADEPTGNLDSENTIEVMNILKKISKSTLVLLVTHDINIARFYSDRIIELKDGSIIRSYDNDSDTTLARDNVNNIYLKDMNLIEETNKIGNIKVYSNGEVNEDINIEIIVRNGNYYIQSNQPIKLVETSNLKIINDHYRDLDIKELEKITYDNSWFRKNKHGIKDSFISITKKFKNAFIKYRNTNKRGKFLHFAFGLMGMLLGASVICMINFATPDTSPFIYADQYHRLTSSDHTFEKDPYLSLVKNYDANKISSISMYDSLTSLMYKRRMSYHKEISLNLKVIVVQYGDNVTDDLLIGNAPVAGNEIVIDHFTANDIKDSFGIGATYQDVIGETIELQKGGQYAKVKIVGVCDGSQRVAYGNQDFYTNWCAPTYKGTVHFDRYFKNEVDSEGNKLYEIIEGRDVEPLNPMEGNFEILLHENSEFRNYEVVNINGNEHIVVGYFRYKDNTFQVDEATNIVNYPTEPSKQIYTNLCVNDEEFIIIDGRKPSGLYECMVSVYSKYDLGDEVDGKEVVGVFNGTYKSLSARYIVDYQSYIILNNDYDQICFKVNADDLYLDGKEVALSLFEYQKRDSLENQASNLEIFRLLSVILVIISAIFIYLVMRSKMFSEIYNVGVYRSLGATRTRVIGKFFLELVILITFTSLIGYILILLVYNFTADSINDLLGQKMFKLSNFYFLLGMLAVYIMNLIVGILPITLLLRKTPSEICSKYDI